MSLKDTLSRRKAKGHPEATRSEFTVEVRQAIAFDIGLVFQMIGDWMVGGYVTSSLRTLRMDIIQHVFRGSPPVEDFTGSDPILIRTYIAQAADDLHALDVVAFCLRYLGGIAHALKPNEMSLFGGRAPANRKFIQKTQETITIVNQRLVDGGIGYQFDGANFVRSPEPELFAGVMEPCLLALHGDEKFQDSEKEFRRALDAWKRKDYKQAVHHSAEALEGMLRVLVKELMPEKHAPSLQLSASVDKLASKRLWHPTYGVILKKIYDIRGDLGAHSEATKPEDGRAAERDAEATVYLAASMLVFLARSYEDHLRRSGAGTA